MNLILIEPREVAADGRVRLDDLRAAHLRVVLRAQPGQRMRAGLLNGPRGTATVEAVDADGVTLQCAWAGETPERPRVDLLLALPRPKVLRRLWAQLAALGVGRILLTNADRVERVYFDTHVLRPDIYRPLLIEGLQQAQDTRLPEVSIHKQLKILVEDQLDRLFPDSLRLVADPAARPPPAAAVPADFTGRLLLAVGPEGGWTAYELDLLARHGFRPVGLGPRTLRSDTACLALLTLVHAALGG